MQIPLLHKTAVMLFNSTGPDDLSWKCHLRLITIGLLLVVLIYLSINYSFFTILAVILLLTATCWLAGVAIVGLYLLAAGNKVLRIS